jgi:8-oxo-dGTP diphosphatase
MKTYRTTKLILRDGAGNVLLLRRSKTHPTQALLMDLPGGVIDGGEQPIEALLRELAEETRLHLDPNDLKLVFAATGLKDDMSALRLVYAAKLPTRKPKVTLSWEHDKYEWLPLEQVEQKLQAGNYKRQAVAYITEHKILEDV